jgi:hypothetical protein
VASVDTWRASPTRSWASPRSLKARVVPLRLARSPFGPRHLGRRGAYPQPPLPADFDHLGEPDLAAPDAPAFAVLAAHAAPPLALDHQFRVEGVAPGLPKPAAAHVDVASTHREVAVAGERLLQSLGKRDLHRRSSRRLDLRCRARKRGHYECDKDHGNCDQMHRRHSSSGSLCRGAR